MNTNQAIPIIILAYLVFCAIGIVVDEPTVGDIIIATFATTMAVVALRSMQS